MKLTFSIFLILFCAHIVSAQCDITTPKTKICEGDIISFSASTSNPVASYNWNFDNGLSSSDPSASSSFQTQGNYTVRLDVTFTSGASCSDSLVISAYKAPIANVAVLGTSVFCFNNNSICLEDRSATPSGQPIVKRNYLWGDGAVDLNNPASSFCHHYTLNNSIVAGVETIDAIGCSDVDFVSINFISDISVSLSKSTVFEDCDSGSYCVSLSVNPLDKLDGLLWLEGSDTIGVSGNDYCFDRYEDFTSIMRVEADHINGCNSYAEASFEGIFPGTMDPSYLIEDTICFHDSFKLEIPHKMMSEDSFQFKIFCYDFGHRELKIDSVLYPVATDTSIQYLFIPDTIGYFTMHIKSLNAIEPCGKDDEVSGWVRGPYTRPGVENIAQCINRDTVMFRDASVYFLNSSDLHYRWEFGDPLVTNTNNYTPYEPYQHNNFSTMRQTRHFYQKIGCYPGSFRVVDSVYGCEDIRNFPVTTGYPALMEMSIVDKQPVYCEGDSVYFNVGVDYFKDQEIPESHKLQIKCAPPFRFYLDSARITKIKVGPKGPFFVFETSKPCGPEDLTLISGDGKKTYFPNGDTLPTYVHDTTCYAETEYNDMFIADYVPISDFELIQASPEGCDKIKVAIRINTEERIKSWKIRWLGNKKDSITHSFSELVLVDTIIKIEIDTGSYVVSAHVFSDCGCETTRSYKVREGLDARINLEAACAGEFIKVSELMNYVGSNNFTGDTALESLSWQFDTFDWAPNLDNLIPYDSAGYFKIRMAYTDYSGACKDTLERLISLNKVEANFSSSNETNICEKLIKFKDQSVVYGEDSLSAWSWDLDQETFSDLQNPFQYYKKKGKYKITLITKSSQGCTDTIQKDINLEGPAPYFDFLTDSIGCYPLEVCFINKSKNSKVYLWEWDDHVGQSQSAGLNEDSICFTYTQAGIYHPRLRAFDTIYNQDNYYVCSEIYPDELLGQSKRTVQVIDSIRLNFQLPSTTCVGERIEVVNKTGTDQIDFFVHGNNSSNPSRIFDQTYIYPGNDTGFVTYTFYAKKKPGYLYPSCSDTFRFTTYIDYVIPEFEYCIPHTDPTFKTIITDNQSVNASSYHWRNQDTSKLHSNKRNAQFKLDSADRTLCLQATSRYGCIETKCRHIPLPTLRLYNAFTPNNDGHNDDYDVEIKEEVYYQLRIFNRWGELVYEKNVDESANSINNWDGTYMNTGSPLPEGEYFYIFNYAFDTCEDHVFLAEGSITLIR